MNNINNNLFMDNELTLYTILIGSGLILGCTLYYLISSHYTSIPSKNMAAITNENREVISNEEIEAIINEEIATISDSETETETDIESDFFN
jgi:hypothetical protein